MFDALETGFGLDFVLWLQSLRVPALEILVKLLDYLGEELLYIALIAFIYWCINKSLGTRLLFVLLSILFATYFVKDSLATERPYEVSDSVNEIVQETSYGIPSGHVAISMAVWGYLAYALRRRWIWLLVLLYIVLQAFGRMMAGAHYPQDTIGGFLLAGLVLALFIPLSERVAAFWKTAAPTPRLMAVLLSFIVLLGLIWLMAWKGAASPLVLTLSSPCPEGSELLEASCVKALHLDPYFTALGLFLGGVLGIWLEEARVHFKAHSVLWRRAVQYLLGIALAMGLLMGLGKLLEPFADTLWLSSLLRVLRYGLVTFFALAIWPWLSIRMGLMETFEPKTGVN
jgi:membrane-associated phospholipid phosphatase